MSTRTVTDCDVCGVQGLPSAYRVSLASGAVIDVCEGCESGAYPKLMKLIREGDHAARERAKLTSRSLDRFRGLGDMQTQAARICTCATSQLARCPLHWGQQA